ncbi:MAG: hypothetical protein JST22_08480 [Bacteroidetes bacterium]|nr:hypothetical protein [Bacteroidota bacterium]
MTQRLCSTLRIGATALFLCLAVPHVAAFAQSNPVKLVKGTITDSKSGKPADGGRVNVYKGTATETFAFSKINPRTGAYQLILAPATDYRFEIISPRFYVGTFTMRSAEGNNYEESVHDFKLDPIPIGQVLLNAHLFDLGSPKLNVTPALQGVVDMMKKQSSVVVAVSVTPDMQVVSAARKPAAKKPKKGAAPAATEPVAPAAGEDPAKVLGEGRVAALKTWFKSQGISTARLVFDLRPPVTLAKGKSADNVSIRISAVQTESESND